MCIYIYIYTPVWHSRVHPYSTDVKRKADRDFQVSVSLVDLVYGALDLACASNSVSGGGDIAN